MALVRRGVRAGAGAGRAGAAVGRLRGLPLVPRDGARVLRGPANRRAAERELRGDQGRPRGAPRRGRRLHGRHPGDDRPGRLADDGVHDPGGRAVLLRDLLPARVLPAPRARGGEGLARRPRRRQRAGRRGSPPRWRERAAPPRRAGARGGPGGAVRPGGGRAGSGLRRPARRVRPGAEVPAVDGAGVPAPPLRAGSAPRRRGPGAGHGDRNRPRHGPGRHVRPARRRLRPVLGGRRLGGAALREDALRQRPARPGLRAPVAPHR